MTIIPDKSGTDGTGGDPGGPVVAVCAGSRCAALWRLREDGFAADADPFETAALRAVRRTVAGTRGALLVRIGCIGACAAAPLVAVAHRSPDVAATSEARWVAQAADPERHAALLTWVGDDWTAGPPPAPAAIASGLLRMAPVV